MRETVHITLRDYQQADIATIHQLLNNFAVSRFLSSRIPFPYSHADAVWWVNTGSKQEITRVIEFDQQLAVLSGLSPDVLKIVAVASWVIGWDSLFGEKGWPYWL
jgi:hypothetical protein